MDKIDLNIDNYDLNDILNLFKISKDFNEEDLKHAKKIVLKTHPDKSNLHPDYFRFYTKAYKVIYSMWEFKNKNIKQNSNTVYDDSIYFNEEKKEILNKFLEKQQMNKKGDFNKWFNAYFEKNKITNNSEEHGYGDWLRSEEDLDENKIINQTQMGEEIERKKQKIKSLIVYNGVNELYASCRGYELGSDVPGSYSSDLFSNLQYEDLRKAHTETVVPVTVDDYNNVKKFKNVNEYNSYRSSQDIKPLSEQQALDYLNKKNQINESESTIRAFKLAKQLEEVNNKMEKSWSNMRLLNDK
jgi:hypothetical protein